MLGYNQWLSLTVKHLRHYNDRRLVSFTKVLISCLVFFYVYMLTNQMASYSCIFDKYDVLMDELVRVPYLTLLPSSCVLG